MLRSWYLISYIMQTPLGLLCLWATAIAAGCGSSLPLDRVVLYQNGIGYFERSGRLDGRDGDRLVVRPFGATQPIEPVRPTAVLSREGIGR